MEKVVQILGVGFVCIIMVCLVWTILSYIYYSLRDDNKLEENLKNFDNKK